MQDFSDRCGFDIMCLS